MRTGVSYVGHHDPKHLELDIAEMRDLQIDDVLLAAQENDFEYFTGKLDFTPKIASDYGLRSIAIIWGALNLFGGGRSSQFLLQNPAGFQVARDGSHRPAGCYMNPLCRSRITQLIDVLAEKGFAGYFVDEPTPLRDCYCPSCRRTYEEWHGGDLCASQADDRDAFRRACVIDYVTFISNYCKRHHPQLETMCCLMPHDAGMWEQAADIPTLDNLGTDLYWVNDDRDVEDMVTPVSALQSVCVQSGKAHHEWLQCWNVRRGREKRVLDQGSVLIREKPDALYVWAWKGQRGTTESCDDPETAWRYACEVLGMAKEA